MTSLAELFLRHWRNRMTDPTLDPYLRNYLQGYIPRLEWMGATIRFLQWGTNVANRQELESIVAKYK